MALQLGVSDFFDLELFHCHPEHDSMLGLVKYNRLSLMPKFTYYALVKFDTFRSSDHDETVRLC